SSLGEQAPVWALTWLLVYGFSATPSFLHIEIAEVGRRLVLAGGHQFAIAAEEVVLVADDDMHVALGAVVLAPAHIAVAAEILGDRPWAGQRVVDRRQLGVEDVCIG